MLWTPTQNKAETTIALMAKSGMDLASAIQALDDTRLFDRKGNCLVDQEWLDDTLKPAIESWREKMFLTSIHLV